jgi:cell division protein FtsI (penicillin-binding protein 3)
MKSKKSGRHTINKIEEGNKERNGYIFGAFTIVWICVLALTAAIIVMLVNTTIIHADDWNNKGNVTLYDSIVTTPMRGEIYSSDGSLLATNLNYYNVAIDFRTPRFDIIAYSRGVDSLADSMARYYPVRTRKEWDEYLRKPLELKRSKRSSNFTLVRKVPAKEFERIRNFPFFKTSTNSNKTGLKKDKVIVRAYPFGDMAKLSIGRVGEVSDPRDSVKRNRPVVRGISGLERALDSLLYGKEGVAYKEMMTKHVAYYGRRDPVNGYGVTTTIDITMQDILEEELGSMLLECNAKWATAILMEVETGDIKAISNLEPDTIHGGLVEAMNRTVLAYEPGSTMKVFSMAVALNEGYAFPIDRVYEIGRAYSYLGHTIPDTHSPATLKVSQFMAYSSNIGMVKLSMPHYQDDPNKFRENLRTLGVFEKFNTGIARERRPYIPTLQNNKGGRLSLSRMVFGYNVMMPPLYTCAFYNAIANDGKFVRPRLVKGLKLPDGTDSIIPVSYIREQMLTPEKNAVLKQMLHDVVWAEGGTAPRLKDDIIEIGGKTGTCNIAIERPPKQYDKDGNEIPQPPFKGGYMKGHNRVTFCGFFPYNKPKYTCLVMFEDPRGAIKGPQYNCGMVLKHLAHKLYSRGLLDNESDYLASGSANDNSPTLYASHNDRRSAILCQEYGITHPRIITPPLLAKNPSAVPDVRGLGIREAVVILETAGLNVKFDGAGYVTTQSIAPGTLVAPGERISLKLTQF